MERYVVHLHNDIDAPDLEGQEFESDREALMAAVTSVRDLASEGVRQGSEARALHRLRGRRWPRGRYRPLFRRCRDLTEA
jgi:hypothetical protein